MERGESPTIVRAPLVDNKELLYHAVRKGHFTRLSGTEVTVSANAYTDPHMRPSVDRAGMKGFDPQETRFNDDSNAVVSLVAKEVRAINDVYQFTASGQPSGDAYVFDVVWRPEPENPAHSQVETDREMNDGTFKRLRRTLAYLSSKRVELDPYEQVVYFTPAGRVYHKRSCHHVKNGRKPVAFQKLSSGAKPCGRCRPEGWVPEEEGAVVGRAPSDSPVILDVANASGRQV